MNRDITVTVEMFPVRRLLVPDCFDAPAGSLLNAPRPLLGEPVEIDRMGFTVTAPEDPRQLRQDLALDAYRLVFVRRSEALEEVRTMIRAEYPEADPDEFDDDDLLGMWSA